MFAVQCTLLQLMYHPTYAPCDTQFYMYQVLHVSAARCLPQGFITIKIYIYIFVRPCIIDTKM